MEAGVLNCPACGAVVSKDSTQCQYCHALLQTVACPKCMGMMFAGTKFCPHCGAAAEAFAQGRDTSRQCPRCNVALTDVQLSRTPLEECTHCGGLWVGVGNFERICSDAETQEAARDLQLPPPIEMDTHVRYLKCAQCGKLMSRLNYAIRSGVIINVCRAHGIWLDRDEIRQIIEFIRAGGLERARKIEQEELNESRRAANAAILPGGTTNFDSSIISSFQSDERHDLLRGIASLANHFLGNSDPK